MPITGSGAYASDGSGDFQDIPDDIYTAMVKDVSEPFDSVNPATGENRTQFTVEWELIPRPDQVEAGCPEMDYTRKQWINLPPTFLDKGAVDRKSKLYELLVALGYDISGPIEFNSDEWQGKEARVVITHNTAGYPKIDSLMPALAPVRKPTPQRAATPVATPAKRQPIGAMSQNAPWRDQ